SRLCVAGNGCTYLQYWTSAHHATRDEAADLCCCRDMIPPCPPPLCGLGSKDLTRYSLDVCAQLRELLLNALVTAIDVIDAQHLSGSLRYQPCKHQTC